MKKLLALALVVGSVALAAPAGSITFGQIDGNRHPNVGAIFADYDPDVAGLDLLCSGTLVSPTVFVTASHCTAFLESQGIAADDVWVTFAPDASDDEGAALPTATLHPGTYHTHPDYGFSGPGGRSDPHDVAVIVFDEPVAGITPARLPQLRYLNSIPLKNQRFTAVGYGTVREDKRRGFHSFFFDGQRRFVTQGFLSLTKSWLNLSMNPSTGSGGTCYGDSGGPHFVGNTNLLVSITVTGDAPCRATDVTYRLDTPSARAFLDDFVALP